MYENAHQKLETVFTKQTPISYPDNLLLLDTFGKESQLI
jgi:hypothetical protein